MQFLLNLLQLLLKNPHYHYHKFTGDVCEKGISWNKQRNKNPAPPTRRNENENCFNNVFLNSKRHWTKCPEFWRKIGQYVINEQFSQKRGNDLSVESLSLGKRFTILPQYFKLARHKTDVKVSFNKSVQNMLQRKSWSKQCKSR